MIVWKSGIAPQHIRDRPPTVRVRKVKNGGKRVSISSAASALLGLRKGQAVVIVTDRGLATVVAHPGLGKAGFKVIDGGDSTLEVNAAAVPDEHMPLGAFVLRQTRLGWAWGDEVEERDTIDEAVDAIIELPPWSPPAVDRLDGGGMSTRERYPGQVSQGEVGPYIYVTMRGVVGPPGTEVNEPRAGLLTWAKGGHLREWECFGCGEVVARRRLSQWSEVWDAARAPWLTVVGRLDHAKSVCTKDVGTLGHNVLLERLAFVAQLIDEVTEELAR